MVRDCDLLVVSLLICGDRKSVSLVVMSKSEEATDLERRMVAMRCRNPHHWNEDGEMKCGRLPVETLLLLAMRTDPTGASPS